MAEITPQAYPSVTMQTEDTTTIVISPTTTASEVEAALAAEVARTAAARANAAAVNTGIKTDECEAKTSACVRATTAANTQANRLIQILSQDDDTRIELMTQEQYDAAKAAGTIQESVMYCIVEEEEES